MRSVDIGLSENGVGHIYSRGVRPRPIPAAHSHRSPVTLTPGGGAASSGTKKVGASGCRASTRYFSKSVMPSAARKISSIRKFPVKLRDGFWNTRWSASASIFGLRDIRITRSPPSRDGVFRHHEGAARVDLMHQVEAAHVGIRDRRSLDGARIVDHDVDAAEGRDGLLDRAF